MLRNTRRNPCNTIPIGKQFLDLHMNPWNRVPCWFQSQEQSFFLPFLCYRHSSCCVIFYFPKRQEKLCETHLCVVVCASVHFISAKIHIHVSICRAQRMTLHVSGFDAAERAVHFSVLSFHWIGLHVIETGIKRCFGNFLARQQEALNLGSLTRFLQPVSHLCLSSWSRKILKVNTQRCWKIVIYIHVIWKPLFFSCYSTDDTMKIWTRVFTALSCFLCQKSECPLLSFHPFILSSFHWQHGTPVLEGQQVSVV